MTSLEDSTLFRFLQGASPLYVGKALELRATVTGWLEYVSNTFPHFTQHSVSHSDEIVSQLSKLLFHDNDPDQSVLDLSPVETYVLIAAAYLHDAGMVVSDAEKQRLLGTAEWIQWVERDGPGHQRWRAINGFRHGSEPASSDLRHFLADAQLRYLLADYYRRAHHERLVPVLAEHQAAFGRFAFDDPGLLETITALCVGHGLSWAELEDPYQFPDRRDVRGDAVNVRLMAVLLRLGDLLDMRNERACPMLVSAASPLPTESVAHWAQYERIRHMATAPDSVEIDAECQTADEHRLLQDWCQWLCDEVAHAPAVMAGSRRHAGWKPPIAKMAGSGSTISIRPAPDATYVPSRWTFELDAEAVVTRLVQSVSGEPLLFVRELLQNALDATRCRLHDLYAARGANPATPDAADLAALSVTVRLVSEPVTNPLSGEDEQTQVLEIADHGVGMSADTIERYLLQIGRSFYTTASFRRSYSFNPTSRFGIGFLSVFRDSDHVVVETATADRPNASDSLKLTLTGPRTYLLVERGERRRPGTTVRIRLRAAVEPGAVRELVSRLCRRVEFPVTVECGGQVTSISPEQPEDFTWVAEAPGQPGVQAEVRALPFAEPGVSGELYVAVYAAGTTYESWAEAAWLKGGYLRTFPGALLPALPESLICLNGLTVGSYAALVTRAFGSSGAACVRVDYRRPLPQLGLARSILDLTHAEGAEDDVVAAAWEVELARHLDTTGWAAGSDGWHYRQRLMGDFPLARWWLRQPGTIPFYVDGARTVSSVDALRAFATVSVLVFTGDYGANVVLRPNATARPVTRRQLSHGADVPVMVDWEVNRLSDIAGMALFSDRRISGTRSAGKRFLAIDWTLTATPEASRLETGMFVGPMRDASIAGFRLHLTPGCGAVPCFINERAPLGRWLLRVKAAANMPGSGVTKAQYAALIAVVGGPLRVRGYGHEELSNYLEKWGASGLSADLRPPLGEIRREAFYPPNSHEPARRREATDG